MNQQLQDFARQELNDGLAKLPDAWQRTFKLMYARQNGKRSVDDACAMSIEDVVKEVPVTHLDLAMTQVQANLRKLSRPSDGQNPSANG